MNFSLLNTFYQEKIKQETAKGRPRIWNTVFAAFIPFANANNL